MANIEAMIMGWDEVEVHPHTSESAGSVSGTVPTD